MFQALNGEVKNRFPMTMDLAAQQEDVSELGVHQVRGGAHLWRIDLPVAEDEVSRLTEHLSDDERSRANRFVRPEDRCRFIVCRAALRNILAEWLNTSPGDLRFQAGEFGKLSLVRSHHHRAIEFNVSHSGRLGCIAVSENGEVGVDVELIRTLEHLDVLAARVLGGREQDRLWRIPQDDRWRTFFRLWTLKEALTKAAGLGILCPFNEIEIDLDLPARLVNAPARLLGCYNPFELHEIEVGDEYCAAVAVRRHEPRKTRRSGRNSVRLEHTAGPKYRPITRGGGIE